MGERRKEAFRVGFDRSVKIEFRGAHVTSDAGLLAFRELDEALGLTGMAAKFLTDTRTGRNTRHALVARLRESVYSRLAGYEDTNDAEKLCNDPVMRRTEPNTANRRTWCRRQNSASSFFGMTTFISAIGPYPKIFRNVFFDRGHITPAVRHRWPAPAPYF